MSATAEEMNEPVVTESDGKYIRVLSDFRKHREVNGKVLDNALRYVIRVLQGKRAQVSAEVERLKAEVEQLKRDDVRWQNARDVWMSERETLKRENEALKNLANNLRPGPISMALAGRMEPATQFEPAIPSVLCKHCRKVFTDHVVIDEFGRNNVCVVEPKPSSEDKCTVTRNGVELALPNDKWIRAQKMPGWAICLDPANRFYGWKMYECNGNWVSAAKLTPGEVDKALTFESLREHWPKFEALRSHMSGDAHVCTPGVKTPFCGKPGCESPLELCAPDQPGDDCEMCGGSGEILASEIGDVPCPDCVSRELRQQLAQEKDIRSDRETTIELVRQALGVSIEPHQTFYERLLEAVRAPKPQASKEQVGPFVVADGGGTGENRFRTLKQGFSSWTLDIDEALQFARRKDAELYAAEDEDAWQILSVPRAADEPTSIHTVGQLGEAIEPILKALSIDGGEPHQLTVTFKRNEDGSIGLINAQYIPVAMLDRTAEPPTGDLAIARACLGNLYVAVENLGRVPSVPRDPDVLFAMREAARFLGSPYNAETKSGSDQ